MIKMSIEQWNQLSAEQIEAIRVQEGYATQAQINQLVDLGMSGALYTLTQERASQLIQEKSAKRRQQPVKDERDYVQCWECGRQVPRSTATFDGNSWYCGC